MHPFIRSLVINKLMLLCVMLTAAVTLSAAHLSPIRILSLDGGGIRGVIEASLLAEMEEELEKPISQVFDMIVGTSTGGILALGLSVPTDDGVSPRYRARDLLEIYSKHGDKVFSASLLHRVRTLGGLLGPKYEPYGLEEILLEHFGNLKMSDAITDVMVTSYHVDGQTEVEFFSYDAVIFPKDRDCLMREAARATSACPGYFPPAKVQLPWGMLENLLDGGMIANNSALLAYLKALEIHPGRDIEIYSIGTGNMVIEESGEDLEDRGLVKWLYPIFRHIQFGRTSSDNDTLHKLLNKDGQENFMRVNVWLDDEHKAMDDYSEENVSYLLDKSKEAMHSPIFRKMIEKLKGE